MNDGDWWRTWSFPMKKTQAKSEGFDKNSVKGNMYATEEYPGCPYCGTFGFVQCNTCHKITCWNSESSLVCEWCRIKWAILLQLQINSIYSVENFKHF